jgi:phenylacetate-coenzyme A ligase PaaK-like adenylate-forming protein
MPGFQQTKNVKVLRPDWMLLTRFRPEALAASVGVLRMLAKATDNGRGRLPSLQCAMIAFTGSWSGGLLQEADRELFWRVFQVPVFEQHLGPDGRVVAWECEAHRGLHLLPTRAVVEDCDHQQLLITSLTDLRRPAVRLRTRFAASIASGDCPCGETSPKLLELREREGTSYGASA